MPKREKTPPPPDDEPRYLVVVHPYPPNANLLLPTDKRTLALWLACCTGKDALLGLFYKPSSPGMVIIEVDRAFDRFDSLLGKHVWSSFLKQPTEENRDKESKVFWCLYNSGRLVQKNGWKRVEVEEHWFHGWTPSNNTIKHPYPKTSYCDVPVEAKTGVPLCRPLPKDTFPPPAPKPRPTVGSAEWIHSRSSNAPSEAPSSSRRRRRGNHGSQIAPSDSASMISSPSEINAVPPPTGRLSDWVNGQRANTVWARAPSSVASISTLAYSTTSSSVGSRTPSTLGMNPSAAPQISKHSVPARPPGSVSAQSVPALTPYESSDWSEDLQIRIDTEDDVPTSPQSASTSRAPGGHTAPPRRAPEPKGAIDPDRVYEYQEEDMPKRSTADAMKAMFDVTPGVGSPTGNDLHNLEEEEEEEDYVGWNYPQVPRDLAPDGEDVDVTEDPWKDYGAPRQDSPARFNIKGGEKWVCPKHGPTCNPGICKERAFVESQRRREKEQDEREEAKRKRREKKERDMAKKARRVAQANGPEVSHDSPHFSGYRYRGSGGSDSESSSDSSADSPTGSESHPPPFSPQDSTADAEGWAEEEPLWDVGENAPPKVSLPGSSGFSASGSSRVEGEDDKASSVGGARSASGTTYPNSNSNSKNNPAPRQQSVRSAVASTRSASAPSARGDANSVSASERHSKLAWPGDARAHPAAASSWGNDPPASAWGTRGAASPPTTTSARGVSSQWPAPGQSQPKSDMRSTASAWTTTTKSRTRNDIPTGPDVLSRPGNGRQRDGSAGYSSSTLSDNRSTGRPGATAPSQASSVSSGARSPASMSRAPTSQPGEFLPIDGGFPNFADMAWADPIAAAQSSSKNSTSGTSSVASRSTVGSDGQADGRSNAEPGQNDRTGRGRRGNRGGRRGIARRMAAVPAATPSQDEVRPVLDATLPPAGPGADWCDENAEW